MLTAKQEGAKAKFNAGDKTMNTYEEREKLWQLY